MYRTGLPASCNWNASLVVGSRRLRRTKLVRVVKSRGAKFPDGSTPFALRPAKAVRGVESATRRLLRMSFTVFAPSPVRLGRVSGHVTNDVKGPILLDD